MKKEIAPLDCGDLRGEYRAAMIFEKILEVLDPEPHPAALNMAIDEVLLRRATGPLIRVYRWARSAVSLGYFDRFGALDAAHRERELVRRWTGGGVVVHGDDVTYSVIVPAGHEFARLGPDESYRRLHRCVAGAIEAAGVPTRLAETASPKRSPGCFENPAAADVLAGERKIAGAAQRRTRWGLLHQGSIQGIALAADFAPRLACAFASEVVQQSLKSEELARAEGLAREKYATDAWLRRF